MKIFGRIEALHDDEGLASLSEATFQASPDALRRVAAFLLKEADEMAKREERYGHGHLRDHEREWFKQAVMPDVIVVQPSAGDENA